jgi:hypothetical protein
VGYLVQIRRCSRQIVVTHIISCCDSDDAGVCEAYRRHDLLRESNDYVALLFCDSFDHYATAQLTEKYSQISTSSPPTITTGGRNPSSTPNNCLSLPVEGYLGRSIPNTTTLIFGAAVNPGNGWPNNQAPFEIWDSATKQLDVILTPSGAITIQSPAGVILATTPTGLIPLNSFTYVEIQIVFSLTTTGSIAIQINGVVQATVSGIQTAYSTNASANLLYIGEYSSGTFATILYDDFYICDGTGTVNNSFLGDVRVMIALPNGNGRINSWIRTGGTSSGNYTAVNDNPPDGDTSYVSSSTVAAIDALKLARFRGELVIRHQAA